MPCIQKTVAGNHKVQVGKSVANLGRCSSQDSREAKRGHLIERINDVNGHLFPRLRIIEDDEIVCIDLKRKLEPSWTAIVERLLLFVIVSITIATF